jgi:imidazole glycerol-phosphate synthase subunit HisH
MTVLVLDYGMGNIASAQRAFEECGAHVIVSDDPKSLEAVERIVIPGVGAFGEAMRRLRERGWVEPLRRHVLELGLPVLGVCLGMQLLASVGSEGGETPGLGLLPGRVLRLVSTAEQERIPHVGWNEVRPQGAATLFHDVPSGSDFYFVHSYHLVPDQPESVIASTPYCGGFVSAVALGNTFGVQFHPEKSSRMGFQVIRNFLAVRNA